MTGIAAVGTTGAGLFTAGSEDEAGGASAGTPTTGRVVPVGIAAVGITGASSVAAGAPAVELPAKGG